MAVVTKKLGSLGTVEEVGGLSSSLGADDGVVSTDVLHDVDLSNETHMDLMFQIGSGSAWSAGDKLVDVYVIRRQGTAATEEHYEVSGTPTFPQESFVGSIFAVDGTDDEYYMIRDVPVPAGHFSIGIHNTHSAALDVLVLNIVPWQYEIA